MDISNLVLANTKVRKQNNFHRLSYNSASIDTQKIGIDGCRNQI